MCGDGHMEKGAIPLVKGTIVLEFDRTEGRASENGRLVELLLERGIRRKWAGDPNKF
jgi:hypothetical protein